jgi:hypothetical protein
MEIEQVHNQQSKESGFTYNDMIHTQNNISLD